MKFEKISQLSDEEFRRLTGKYVQKNDRNFDGERGQKEGTGRQTKQIVHRRSPAYDTRISAGISDILRKASESACYRNVQWIEETLVEHPDFKLPGKKELLKSDAVVVIDSTR